MHFAYSTILDEPINNISFRFTFRKEIELFLKADNLLKMNVENYPRDRK